MKSATPESEACGLTRGSGTKSGQVLTLAAGFGGAGLAFGACFAGFAAVVGTKFGSDLSAEDGFIESLGAIAFLLVALLEFLVYRRSRVEMGSLQKRLGLQRNVFHLLLAFVFLLGFGEEISWGQRLIGWETPEAVKSMNEQGETNFHNLAPLHGDSLLNVSRLFNLFWFSYCVLVPLTNLFLPAFRNLYQRFQLPVPQLWIGGAFIACYLTFRAYIFAQGGGVHDDANELKESLLAVCFFAMALSQFRGQRNREQFNGDQPGSAQKG